MERLTLSKTDTLLVKNGDREYRSPCFGCESIRRCNPSKVACGFYKALEKLKEYEDTDLSPEGIMDLKEFEGSNAEKYLRETAKHRWIPVTERLPEESLSSVIGWDEYRGRCCFAQYYDGKWILGNDTEPVKIIAWSPLPEPYSKRT